MPVSETSLPGSRSTWIDEFRWWFACLLIALFASWPLGASLTSSFPVGCEGEVTVQLLNVWTLWWNCDRAADSFRGYWNAPIFYPTQGAFAFSEAQPPMALTAPVLWLTGNRVLAYNIYLLMILSLNGCSCRRLLGRIGYGRWSAFCGGVMCEMLPFVWWQLGVVQLTTVFGINWTIHSVIDVFSPESDNTSRECSKRLTDVWSLLVRNYRSSISLPQGADRTRFQAIEPSRSVLSVWLNSIVRALRLGGSFGLTYWLCNYWGLFLALLLIPSSIAFWNLRMLRWQFWIEIALAACVSLVLVGPIAIIQNVLAKEHHWTRDHGLIIGLSAHPRDYLDTPAFLPDGTDKLVPWTMFPKLEFPEEARTDSWSLGGGTVKVLAAALGFAASLFSRRRRWGLFAAGFTLIAFSLSLGPNAQIPDSIPIIRGKSLYSMLQQYCPGFALIRSPFRFALFVQLGIVWLSVEMIELLNPRRWPSSAPFGLESLESSIDFLRRCTGRSFKNLRDFVCSLIMAAWSTALRISFTTWLVLSFTLLFEVWPPRQSLYSISTPKSLPVWITWLREHSDVGDAVVCLPLPNGGASRDYLETTIWMYWGTFHARPLVNGYSGFFPDRFVKLKDSLRLGAEGSTLQLKLYPWNSPGLKQLNDCGARFIAMKRTFATRDDVWNHHATKFRWAWVAGDDQEQVDIYEIQPP